MRLTKNFGLVIAIALTSIALISCGGGGGSSSSGGGGTAPPPTGGNLFWGDGTKEAPQTWDQTAGATYPGMYNTGGNGGTITTTPVDNTAFYPTTGHPVCCPDTCPSNTPETDQREADLRTLINAYRLNNGLAPLTEDPALDQIGRGEVKHQVIHNYTGLVNPEGDDVSGRLDLAGVASVSATESQDIGLTTDDAQTIFNRLVADPIANQNLLDPTADGLGVGYTNTMDNNGRTSVVVNRSN